MRSVIVNGQQKIELSKQDCAALSAAYRVIAEISYRTRMLAFKPECLPPGNAEAFIVSVLSGGQDYVILPALKPEVQAAESEVPSVS
jgi:hypothetical protein